MTALVRADAILLVDLDPSSSLESTLSVSQPLGTLPQMVAFESMGAVLPNRIELRYDSTLELQLASLEEGWSHQSMVINEGLTPVGLSTFFFSGFDSQNDLEFYSFYDAWEAAFSFSDPQGALVAAEVSLQVDVFASVVLPGSGQIPVSLQGELVHNDTEIVPVSDHGSTLPMLFMGVGMTIAGTLIRGRLRQPSSHAS